MPQTPRERELEQEIRVLEAVNGIYFRALTSITRSGRQSPELRIARTALKEASYTRITGFAEIVEGGHHGQGGSV